MTTPDADLPDERPGQDPAGEPGAAAVAVPGALAVPDPLLLPEPDALALADGEAVDGELVDAPRGGARLQLAGWVAAHRPADPAASAERLADAAQAPSTIARYDAGWADFTLFAARFGIPAGPPAETELVALYLADLAGRGLAVDTIGQRIAAIRDTHHRARHWSPTDDPRIKAVLVGIRLAHGRTVEGKAAISFELLAAMLATRVPGPDGGDLAARRARLAALRDRCLLTLGFFAALRRDELAGLPVDALEDTGYGLRVLVGGSKTDPGAGPAAGTESRCGRSAACLPRRAGALPGKIRQFQLAGRCVRGVAGRARSGDPPRQ